MAKSPSLIAWTDHARLRANQFGITHVDAEAAVMEGHARRTSNPGSGDWMATGRGVMVVYDWPTEDGPVSARLVTLWLAE